MQVNTHLNSAQVAQLTIVAMPMDDLFDVSQITGNASDDIKRIIADTGPGGFFQSHRIGDSSTMFGESMLKRMKVAEISLNRNAEEEKKVEARVVIELDVTEGQYIY